MFHKAAIAGIALLIAPGAGAQVFVIGGGMAEECYTELKSGNYSFRATETLCTRALREETLSTANRAATYVNRGVLRMREEQYDQALSDYEAALSINAELGAAYLNMGAAYIFQRDYSAAMSPLDKAIALDSKDLFAAYYNRAIVKESLGDVEGAYFDFSKALELRPGWEMAERQLARFTVTQN